jgi:7-cyano-7-deazaguanine synthase
LTAPVIVLASGGLDSTACIAYYIEQDAPVSALWVDYRQPAARAEENAIKRIVRHYQVPIQKLNVKGINWPKLTRDKLFEFRGRNLSLVSLALNTSPEDGALIALGIHKDTPFSDCSASFAERTDDLLALLSDGRVRLDCPFLNWTKSDIASYAANQRIPFKLIYSCERGEVPPCKECAKCRDLLAASEIVGSVFSDNDSEH